MINIFISKKLAPGRKMHLGCLCLNLLIALLLIDRGSLTGALIYQYPFGAGQNNFAIGPQQQPSQQQQQQLVNPLGLGGGSGNQMTDQQSQQQLPQLQQSAVSAQLQQQQDQISEPVNQGLQQTGVDLQKQAPPHPIFRYNGAALNSTSVRLVWSLLSGYHADSFSITYGPIPEATNLYSVEKLNGTVRDYTINSLRPDTYYQFELFTNIDGRSFKPQMVAVRTPPVNYAAAKSDQEAMARAIMPFGLKAEAKSNTSIQLTWTEPERPVRLANSRRVNFIRYYVNTTPNPQQQSSQSTGDSQSTGSVPQSGAVANNPPQYLFLNVTDARESRVIVQKLKPATEYAFAIRTSYYSLDMKRVFLSSGFSMDTIARTHDVEPSAPRNFTIQLLAPTKEEIEQQQLGANGQHQATGKLELSWLPPESPNGQLKGYIILYALEQGAPDEQWSRIEVNGPNINNWYVANLKPGWRYYFKMRAVNQRGQSPDSDTRLYVAPPALPLVSGNESNNKMMNNMPAVPANNVLLLIVICMVAILFLLFLVVSKLACRTRRKPRKGSLNGNGGKGANGSSQSSSALDSSVGQNGAKLSAYHQTGSSSTVAARVGTLARRRDQSAKKSDFWISAMDHNSVDAKSNASEKSQPGDMNMAMVSIQRESPQFTTTTQLAPALPDYRFAAAVAAGQQAVVGDQLLQQLHHQQQSHYGPGHFTGSLAYDQMDNATASALMTLSKRQQQQLQKYQIQFATTGGMPPSSIAGNNQQAQAPSPHQQPPPPPPLNIEQQQQQQQQSLYGAHHTVLGHTRSLRLHRPTLYDPVSGAFVQASAAEPSPPNYNSHHTHQMHPLFGANPQSNNSNGPFQNNSASNTSTTNSNALQFTHPHQTSTLMSRRSTNTLRSFQTSTANSTYGQFGVGNNNTLNSTFGAGGNTFVVQPPTSIAGINNQPQQQPQQLLQSHQAVINQLNNSTYPSLPLKHVSTVRPQIMSSLEDQIEMELAEKEQQQQDQQQTIKQ